MLDNRDLTDLTRDELSTTWVDLLMGDSGKFFRAFNAAQMLQLWYDISVFPIPDHGVELTEWKFIDLAELDAPVHIINCRCVLT